MEATVAWLVKTQEAITPPPASCPASMKKVVHSSTQSTNAKPNGKLALEQGSALQGPASSSKRYKKKNFGLVHFSLFGLLLSYGKKRRINLDKSIQ
jgi:hypothetical protein